MAKKPRILFLLTYYYPHWTGLTQYARRLAEALAARGYAVSVLTVKHEATLAETEVIAGVQVIRKQPLFRLSRTFVSPAFVYAFWKQIRETDEIFIYLPFAEVLIAVVLAKLFRKKIFLVHNGDLVLPAGLLNRLLETFYFLSTDLAIKLSTAIIIQTEDYARHSPLLSRNKDKWQVVLPLYESETPDETTMQALRKQLLTKRPKVVGFAGRFVEEKGFDILLKAIPLVIKRNPDVQFVFAGDTNIVYERFFMQQQGLIAKHTESLTLLGTLNNSQMAAFYRLCDVFVISSRTDCFPSTEIEALLVGTPVVVTDIPGARWGVLQTNMGMIVPTEDPKALAEGIVSALDHKKDLVKNAPLAKALFNYNSTIAKYEKLL